MDDLGCPNVYTEGRAMAKTIVAFSKSPVITEVVE
jgi:hypothetical protein